MQKRWRLFQINMKCLIDTNVILDVLMKRKGLWEDSSIVLKACETGRIEGLMTVQSFLDMTYVLHKELNSAAIRKVLEWLSLILHITEINGNDLKKATEYEWNDYEDAVQAAVADRCKADYIITRNIKDYKGVKTITPEEMIKLI